MSANAVCARCGAGKAGFESVCSACGHRPAGDGLLVAWLLSSNNLDEAALEASGERIRGGETLRPSARMLSKARRALGRQFSTDVGLPAREVAGLLALNLLFTPLVGWICALWWWAERPRAAVQAGLVTAPVSVLTTVVWLLAMGVV